MVVAIYSGPDCNTFIILTCNSTQSDLLSSSSNTTNKLPNLLFLDDANHELVRKTNILIASVQCLLPQEKESWRDLNHVIFVTHVLPPHWFKSEFDYVKNRNLKISIVYLCEWTRQYVEANAPYLVATENIETLNKYVIGNPLMSDVLPDLRANTNHIVRDPHAFVFLSTWERGGDIALSAFRRIRQIYPDAVFHVASYNPNYPTVCENDGVIVHKSLGKVALSELLLRCGTFIYPLCLPNGHIHKDTFACCVSEAIALGVNVITYRQGALAELYAECVDFVQLPENILNTMTNFNFHAFESWLTTDEAINDIVVRVVSLLSKNDDAERIRRSDIVRAKYLDAEIGRLWNDLMIS